MPDAAKIKKFHVNVRRQTVEGRYIRNGKHIRKRLCAFADVGLTPDGTPKDSSPRAEKQRASVLAQRYAEIYAALEKEIPRGKSILIQRALQDWLDYVQIRQAEKTSAMYSNTANRYISAAGNHPLATLSPRHIDAFTSALIQDGLSPASVNIHLRTLQRALNWMVSREMLDKFPRVEKLPVPKRLPRTWTQEQTLALFRHLRKLATLEPNRLHRRHYQHHERFLWLASLSGCRRSEIMFLRWDQIDFEARQIRVLIQSRFMIKERREKLVPLLDALAAYLAAQRAAHPEETWIMDNGGGELAYSDAGSLTKAFRRHYLTLDLPPAGLRPKALHGFRASFASRLLSEFSLDLETARQWLGHSSLEVTRLYISNPGDKLHQAAKTINESPPFLGHPCDKEE